MNDDISWGETPPMTHLGIPGVGVWGPFERGETDPRVPIMALTPELLEAIQISALAYSEFCGIASDECNKHVRIIREAIAAAQKEER